METRPPLPPTNSDRIWKLNCAVITKLFSLWAFNFENWAHHFHFFRIKHLTDRANIKVSNSQVAPNKSVHG